MPKIGRLPQFEGKIIFKPGMAMGVRKKQFSVTMRKKAGKVCGRSENFCDAQDLMFFIFGARV